MPSDDLRETLLAIAGERLAGDDELLRNLAELVDGGLLRRKLTASEIRDQVERLLPEADDEHPED